MYYVIHVFIDFQMAEFAVIILHISLALKFFLCFALMNRKHPEKVGCVHRLTLLLDLTAWNISFKWIILLMSAKTLYTLTTKTGVFATKIISIFLSFLSRVMLSSSSFSVPSSPASQTKSPCLHEFTMFVFYRSLPQPGAEPVLERSLQTKHNNPKKLLLSRSHL